MLSGETVSPARLLFKYTKAFSNSDKLKVLIAPKITDITKFFDNNRKYAIYTGGDIDGTYSDL